MTFGWSPQRGERPRHGRTRTCTTPRASTPVALMELHRDDPRPALLQAAGVPFVAFGRPWGTGGSSDYPWVDVDGADGTEKAVDHCVGRGYRRIAFLGWERGSSISDDRCAGWRRALARHGLPADSLAQGGPDTVDNGRRLAEQIIGDAEHPLTPTALVCVSDSIALGAMAAARARGAHLRPGHRGRRLRRHADRERGGSSPHDPYVSRSRSVPAPRPDCSSTN